MEKPDPLIQAGLVPADEEPEVVPQVPAEPAIEEVPEDDPVEVPEGAKNPDAVQKAIQEERKLAREANARAREYEARLRAQEEEGKPLEERISKAEEEARSATIRALQYEVAAEVGIDLKLANRLQGATREELLADAEAFKPALGSPAPAAPPDGGHRQDPPVKADPVKEHNAFIGSLLGLSQGRTDPLAGLAPAPQD